MNEIAASKQFMYSLGIAIASLKEKSSLKESNLSEMEAQSIADLEYAHKLGYTATIQHFVIWLIPEENYEKMLETEQDKEYAVFIRKIWDLVKGEEK